MEHYQVHYYINQEQTRFKSKILSTAEMATWSRQMKSFIVKFTVQPWNPRTKTSQKWSYVKVISTFEWSPAIPNQMASGVLLIFARQPHFFSNIASNHPHDFPLNTLDEHIRPGCLENV